MKEMELDLFNAGSRLSAKSRKSKNSIKITRIIILVIIIQLYKLYIQEKAAEKVLNGLKNPQNLSLIKCFKINLKKLCKEIEPNGFNTIVKISTSES